MAAALPWTVDKAPQPARAQPLSLSRKVHPSTPKARAFRERESSSGLCLDVPQDRRGDKTETAPSRAELLQPPGDAVMAEGLDLGRRAGACEVDIGIFAGRGRADDPEVEVAADFSGHLGRAEDGRPIGHVEKARGGGPSLGAPADAPAVKEVRVLPAEHAIDVRPAPAEIEDARAFDEEGPLLLVVGLFVADIDDGRVDLDLAEIRIDREVEGQVAAEAALEVEAAAHRGFASVAERVAGDGRAEHGPRQGERRNLEAAAGGDAREPGELGEVRDEPVLLLGHPGEMVLLVLALDHPLEIDAPDMDIPSLETELVEGDADLDRPAQVVDAGGALPDPVPGRVQIFIVEEGAVLDRTEGIDPEVVSAPAVVIGVEADVEPVGFDGLVAAAETADDLAGLGVGEPGGDIEIVAVEGDPDGRGLARGLSVLRIALGEAAGTGGLPNGLGQDAVDRDGSARGQGGDRPDGARVVEPSGPAPVSPKPISPRPDAAAGRRGAKPEGWTRAQKTEAVAGPRGG